MQIFFLSLKLRFSSFFSLFFLLELNFPLFLLILSQKVLSSFHLNILLSRSRLGWERSILFFLENFLLLFLKLDLFEFWQELIPILLFHIVVFHELSFDHELFDMIDGMDILHSINNYPS